MAQIQSENSSSLTLPPYPDRFYASAQYAAIPGTCEIKPTFKHANRFNDASSLLLYSLYQQAIFGPCNTQKPWAWNVVESAKWESWKSLADMSSVEAMRLFVRYLEQEDPAWWELAHEDYANSTEPISILPTTQPIDPTLQSLEEMRSLPNGNTKEEDDDLINRSISEFFTSLPQKNTWISVPIQGKKPTARYQHSAIIVGNKLFVIGGNFNGRYLNDVQMLNLTTLTWKKIETVNNSDFPPCAGHSLIAKDEKTLWLVAGLSRESNDKLIIRELDLTKKVWSIPKLRGYFPPVRGGQSVNIIGNSMYVFGGEDLKRKLMNDLFILDMVNMVWEKVETKGTPPSPRSDHASAVYANRFLLIFGGGSHSICYNDLYILDLENLVWSQPEVRGIIPSPRAGHSSVMIGKNWFVIGGGDNSGGIPDTMVLELDTMTWNVVSHLSERNSIACEGLTVVHCANSKDPFLLSFAGYNGRYSNDTYVFQPDLTEMGKINIPIPEPNSQTLPISTQPGPITLSQNPINILINSITAEEDKKREDELAQSAKDKWRNLAKSSKDLDLADQLNETEEALARAEAIALNARADAQLVAGKAKADAWATIAQAQLDMEDLKTKLAAATKSKQAAEEEAREAVSAKVNAQAAMGGLEAEASALRKELSRMSEKYEEMESTVEKVTKNSELTALKKDYASAKRSLADTEQELQSSRAALVSEQARCFKLEVEVAELRQRLQGMDALEHEVELLRRQQAAADEAAAAAASKGTPGVWGWLAPAGK